MGGGVHGRNKLHREIALCLISLGVVYRAMGELDKALEKHEQSLDMYRAVHGHNRLHHDLAISLCNIGFIHPMERIRIVLPNFRSRVLRCYKLCMVEIHHIRISWE